MKRIIALIIVIILAVAGYYYYTGKTFKVPASPADAYNQIMALPNSAQGKAFQATVNSWIKDPASAIPYPKGWKKVSVTTYGKTFDVVTPDTGVPPQYYVSFIFPKSVIPKEHLIKCLGTGSSKTTDICVVGDNPEINAYYKIMDWITSNPLTGNPNSSSSATTAS